jgi:hypothetical protein
LSMNLTPHSAPKMPRAARYKHKIATLRKNSMERLDITLEEYNGCDLLNLAVVRDSTGNHSLNRMKGTARFVSVNVCLLPQLIVALQDAQHRAHELGLLPSEIDTQKDTLK